MRGATLARRISALFGVLALALLAAFTASIVITGQNREASTEIVDRISPSHRAAGDLLTAIVEQQNAIRGYALRGEESALQEYRTQLGRQEAGVADLMVLLPADPALRGRLDRILESADRWHRDAAEPIVEVVARSGPRPPDDELYRVEQQRFDPLATDAEGLQADLQQAGDRAAERLAALDRLEVGVIAVSTVLVAGVFVTAVLLARRWVSIPLAALAADARPAATTSTG